MEETIKYTVTINHGERAEGIYDSYDDAAYAWYMKEREQDPSYMDWCIEEYKADYGKVPSPAELYEEADSSFGILEVTI